MYPGFQTRLSGESAVIASAASITVKTDMIRVTGTTSIATISPPVGKITSILFIVPTSGTVALLTTGNIAVAVSMAVNRVTVLLYNRITNTWYPGAIS